MGKGRENRSTEIGIIILLFSVQRTMTLLLFKISSVEVYIESMSALRMTF